MLLSERLQGVVAILDASNMELESPKAYATGYVAAVPSLLAQAVMQLLEHADTTQASLDIGCGNGGWLLLAAAAGFPSYGVEINPFLIDHCQRNYDLAVAAGYIDAATPCAFIVGDMIPARFAAAYDTFRAAHALQERTMPVGAVVDDTYARLPVSVGSADIIYCWSWPTQSGFLYTMLESEAKEDAIFVLPSYEKYMGGPAGKSTLELYPLATAKTVYIGRRAATTGVSTGGTRRAGSRQSRTPTR